MSKNIYIGSDPDIHNFSCVAIDDDNNIVFIALSKTKKVKGQKSHEAACQMATDGVHRFIDWYVSSQLYDGHHIKAIAVEGQKVVYTHRTGANPQDLIELASVAGSTLCALTMISKCSPDPVMFLFPKPSEWKGSVPKPIHQCRTMTKAGLKYTKKGGSHPYPVPDKDQLSEVITGPDKINDSDWADITDSLGLAIWAKEQYLKSQKKGR